MGSPIWRAKWERERKMWRKKKNVFVLVWFGLPGFGYGWGWGRSRWFLLFDFGLKLDLLSKIWFCFCCYWGELFVVSWEKNLFDQNSEVFFSFIYFLWVGISCQHLLLFNKIVNSAFVSITNNNDQNKTRIKVNDQIYSNLIKFSTRS